MDENNGCTMTPEEAAEILQLSVRVIQDSLIQQNLPIDVRYAIAYETKKGEVFYRYIIYRKRFMAFICAEDINK